MSHPGETVLSSLPILPSLEARLNIFRSAFSHPSSFENFVGLTAGSLLSVKNPTVADSIRAANLTQYKHFSAFYRFFHRALWEPDLIGWIFLSVLFNEFLDNGAETILVIDDTFHPRIGRKVFGAGFQHDPLLPMANKQQVNWGNCWVVLTILLPVPGARWPVAIPVLSRLFIPEKRAAKLGVAFQTKPQIAAAMLADLTTRYSYQRFLVLVDQGYTNKTVLRELPKKVTLLGRIPLNAALYDEPKPRKPGQLGRSRKWGMRQDSCSHRAQNETWDVLAVDAGDKEAPTRSQSFTAQWKGCTDGRLCRVVLVERDNSRKTLIPYFSTDPDRSPTEILSNLMKRWSIELMFHEVKEELGVDGVQVWCEDSVRRLFPMRLLSYGLLWWDYWADGADPDTVPPAHRPWYRHKKTICFADLLRRARLPILLPDFYIDLDGNEVASKIPPQTVAWIKAVC